MGIAVRAHGETLLPQSTVRLEPLDTEPPNPGKPTLTTRPEEYLWNPLKEKMPAPFSEGLPRPRPQKYVEQWHSGLFLGVGAII